VTWLGTSSGTPTRDRNISCTLVRLPGAMYMVDCGEGSHRQARCTGLQLEQVMTEIGVACEASVVVCAGCKGHCGSVAHLVIVCVVPRAESVAGMLRQLLSCKLFVSVFLSNACLCWFLQIWLSSM
jgi:hypothetical protein